MKPIKHSVAVVIKNQKNQLLIVRRPDNEDSPVAGNWGLPAITLNKYESERDAAYRIGTTKLNVTLKVGEKLGERTVDRGKYMLHLCDYAAEIVGDTLPSVSPGDSTSTKYVALKYTSNPALLIPKSNDGSLFADLSAIVRYTQG